MVKERDTQRSKLYAAERASIDGVGPQNMSIAECQAYVDKVLTSAFVQSRWGRHTVRVRWQRGGGMSRGGVITLGTWARQPAVILHELAHELMRGRGAAHGPEFAACFLTLVTRFMGSDAGGKLREQYRVHKVKYRAGMAAVPKAGTRPVVTKTAVAAKQKAAATRPLTLEEHATAARLLRRAIAAGSFGPPGRKPRAHAQAVARTLEGR